VAFARWDPFRELIAIQHRLDRLAGPAAHEWAPAVDICETETAFIITAELPGLAREQVEIAYQDGRLTLQGRRDCRVPCEQYHQLERGHGEFLRSFDLPQPVDGNGITADLAHGVLTVTVPKSREALPRHVPIT
jgi:HSP20 family protein